MYKNAIEIGKFPGNCNGEDGRELSKTWLPTVHQEKKRQETEEDNIKT